MPATVDTFVGTAAPLSQHGFDEVARQLDVDPESLWSLLTVETRGFGFLPDRRPKILYERHIFHRRTGGTFSMSHPDISGKGAGGYATDTAGEYDRLTRAMVLDDRAALESASWGLGQVMGFNASTLGYPAVQDMVISFLSGEDAQLDGSRRFIAANGALATAFRARRWATVAFFYNGEDYARNQYDVKLERHYHRFKTGGTPSVEVRAGQARLTYLGFDPRGVDGVVGKGTRRAARTFQAAQGLRVTGDLDDATLQRLKDLAGV
jgi:hypothetical protein